MKFESLRFWHFGQLGQRLSTASIFVLFKRSIGETNFGGTEESESGMDGRSTRK